MHLRKIYVLLLIAVSASFGSAQAGTGLGIFEGESDVGNSSHAGSVQFDAAKGTYVKGTYLVSGGGSNIWSRNDAFHFVWKKISGDASLAADISFVGGEGDAHRKACLIIRQNLEPGSPYADAALHGNGLTALQYRETDHGITSNASNPFTNTAPTRLRIEKRGEFVSMSIAVGNEKLHPASKIRIAIKEPYYIGIGVCAHDDKVLRQAIFSEVELIPK